MIAVAATVLVAVAIGIAVERRAGDRAERAASLTLAAMLYVLVPFIAFFNVARLELTVNVGGGIGLGWIALALTTLAGWALARSVLRLDRPATGSLALATLQANTGYLGLPLVAALFGADAIGEAIAYDQLVQLPALLIGGFGIGAAFGTRVQDTRGARAKAFLARNPPLLAVALGLVAPDAFAPDVLVDASRIAIVALAPLGFFAVGVTLSAEAEAGRLRIAPPVTPALVTTIVLRLVVAPLLLLALAAPFIDLPATYLLLAAMPAGINVLVIAHAYGLDRRLAADAIVWTTAIALAVGIVASLIG